MLSTDEKKKQMRKNWEAFIQGSPVEESAVRDIILDSWKRSKEYGVDPFAQSVGVLPETELKRRLQRRKELIDTANPYLKRIYSIADDSSFYVALTDEDGYILSIIGNREIVTEASETTSAVLGCCRHESAAGTNAMGLCLALNQPVQTVGSEHYMQSHHRWTCSAAPIHDDKGKIIGILDFTAPQADAHSHTLGMVAAAVDGIEKELKMLQLYREEEVTNQLLSETIESLSSSVIVIDMDGNVKHINNVAKNVLNISSKLNPTRIKLRDYLDLSEYIDQIMRTKKNISNVKLSIDSDGKSYGCVMSISIISRFNDEINLLVVTLEDMKSVYKLVNKFGGTKANFTFDSIKGNSEAISSAIEMGKIAARIDSNILLLGESGTGKELFAQSIHNMSRRSQYPFVAINCGALPKGLIESELFGYEAGAFTGAKKEGMPGKFELADGGTILLDEIADMPFDVQVSLLRVLQNKEVTRIGGKNSKKIDVRIIAATNKNLEEAVSENTFREDLYFRLNVFPILIPPLRERNGDAELLAEYFVSRNRLAEEKGITGIADDALLCMKQYSWPGNIRELENIIERSVILCQGTYIRKKDLPISIVRNAGMHRQEPLGVSDIPETASAAITQGTSIEDVEREMIIAALIEHRGNVKKSADSLGINRRTLYNKLKKMDISCDKYRI